MRIRFMCNSNWGLSFLFAGCFLLGSFAYDVRGFVLRDDRIVVQNLVLSFFSHNVRPGSLVCAKEEDLQEQTLRSFKSEYSRWATSFKKLAILKRLGTTTPPSWPQFLARRFISESDCNCSEGYTSTSSDSPCGCVIPLQVGIELGVSLDTLFLLVIELAKELADGSFLPQSQVRIMNVKAVGNEKEKTDVEAHLVPLGDVFDNTTAHFIAERFWTKQVYINETLFGNYSILYIDYPGLPQRNNTSGSGPHGPPGPGGVLSPGNRGSRKSKLSKGVIAIVALSCAVAFVALLAIFWLLGVKCRGSESTAIVEPSYVSSAKVSGSLAAASYGSTALSFSSSCIEYSGSVRTFSLSELETATDNFKLSNVVGEGAFGRVFQGQLETGVRVAVKVLTHSDDRGGQEFLAEAELSSRLHHRNLVKLLGVCAEGHIRSLVYELIPNGSVESHLHDLDAESIPLNWDARIKIALGAARGLAYLHEDSNPRVIHRDFKASNILLEYDFTPKISDFGLAKIASEGGREHISTRVMGTFGYVAPEYAMTGHLLVKSDVYSYGVVLLELLSGRKPVDMNRPPGQENLVTWARPLLSNVENLEQVLDPTLKHGVPLENLARVAAIAYMCVQPEVSHRPFMGEVVQALKLVYNDSEISEGRPSFSGSHAGEDFLSGEGNHVSGETFASKSPYTPSSTLAPDSGPMNMGCESDPVQPASASAFLSYSSRSIRRLSGSFRRHSNSGHLRTTRSRPAWYRVRYRSGGTMSEHSNNNFEVGLRDRFELWP